MLENAQNSGRPALPTQRVTTSQLLAAPTSGPTGVVGHDRRALVVAGVPVATIGADPSKLNPLSATSAEGMPVVEILAAIASQHPTGVLVLEGPRAAEEGFAFPVKNGRVMGARGPGTLDQLEPFMAEVHRRFPERFEPEADGRPAWHRLARAFVTERVLDNLELTRKPGARMTFLRGDVEWIGPELPPDGGPQLEHLLLEHARRWDERPGMLKKLGPLDRVVIPLHQPAADPSRDAGTQAGGDDDWDFFEDPDPAALEEWRDACALFALCDGEITGEELIEQAMLGRFRGLAGLHILVTKQHACLVAAPDRTAASRRKTVDLPPAQEAKGEVIRLPSAAEPAASRNPSSTEYSVVSKSARMRRVDTLVSRVPANPRIRAPGSRPPKSDRPFTTGPQNRERTRTVVTSSRTMPAAGAQARRPAPSGVPSGSSGALRRTPRAEAAGEPPTQRDWGESPIPLEVSMTSIETTGPIAANEEPPLPVELDFEESPAELSHDGLRPPDDLAASEGATRPARASRGRLWMAVALVASLGIGAGAMLLLHEPTPAGATEASSSP